MSQQTLSFEASAGRRKNKVTRRESLLNELDRIVPWQDLAAVVAPYYSDNDKVGRRAMPLERMIRIHVMQKTFNLSDPAMEDALYDSDAMRRFAGIDPFVDVTPDESTILRFRHLLEKHNLGEALFVRINELLTDKGLMLTKGTIVDATIIDAPSSTKNKENQRDPEMHQTRKGNQWYFGMKVHLGTDASSGAAHTAACTPANVADIELLDDLLHGEEKAVYGDKGYTSAKKEEELKERGVSWKVARKAKQGKKLPKKERVRNRRLSKVRARGEHLFGIVKHLWGHRKVRYRGIDKNAGHYFTVFALANLYLLRRRILTA